MRLIVFIEEAKDQNVSVRADKISVPPRQLGLHWRQRVEIWSGCALWHRDNPVCSVPCSY